MPLRKYCLLLFLTCSIGLSAQIKSGIYEDGLKLAYNPSNTLVTGFYEQYTGLDETTGNAKFSCIFYITGNYKSGEVSIETFYPLEEKEDLIQGKLRIDSANSVSIKLNDDHGGCWNVWPFKYEFSKFSLEEAKSWIEIRYVNSGKAFFYRDMDEESIRKAYLVSGDIVYVDKVEGTWGHCTYYGKAVTTGWVKLASLNTP